MCAKQIKERKGPIQSRNYCFSDFQLLDIKKIYENYSDIIRYVCWGKEVCPKTLRDHYQGWIQFINKKRFNGAKKIFGCNKIHIESCYGNEFDNDKYCKKDGKYQSIGQFISQGYRSDIEQIKNKIDNGGTMLECANDNFQLYLQYGRGLKEYKNMVDKKKRKAFRKVNVKVYSGSTGTGKTRRAMDQKKDVFKITGSSLDWWDGYEGEEIIVIDEYNNDVPITKMLNILDGYELRLPIKGSFTYANWNKVIITTNLDMNEIHPCAKSEHKKALFRRITKWKQFK